MFQGRLLEVEVGFNKAGFDGASEKPVWIWNFTGGVFWEDFDFEGDFDKKTLGLVYKIPIIFILSYFILKYRFFRHHLITLGFNILNNV